MAHGHGVEPLLAETAPAAAFAGWTSSAALIFACSPMASFRLFIFTLTHRSSVSMFYIVLTRAKVRSRAHTPSHTMLIRL
jgi:hypothetical protein